MGLSVATAPSSPMSVDVDPENESEKIEQKKSRWAWMRLKRAEPTACPNQTQRPDTPPQTPTRPGFTRRLSRKLNVGIPRSTTFKRQEDEQRKNLEPVQPTIKDRKDVLQVRQRALSAQPLPHRTLERKRSAPQVGYTFGEYSSTDSRMNSNAMVNLHSAQDDQIPPPPPPPPHPPPQDPNSPDNQDMLSETTYEDAIDEEIREELEKKWILNLSMHFRDKTPREKFFLTYAETPQKWRRVTVSCDYRDAPPDSLEADLQALQSQRDKSARIYESIRMSLVDIQFYDTVTNLKLETRDDRLHVHVTEDVNEIIPYPLKCSVAHLNAPRFKESQLHFVEHMSGFVYKVNVGTHTWVKKEIPGPDSVEEFLYEVNALSSLVGCQHVIQLKGIVVSEDGQTVKGLLIGYAKKNALVEVIYDNQGKLPWPRKERWAKQIVQGLSEIHEAGFVQGDFTLSNIVIDKNDDVKIIDINRRGCPVGWEPPEITSLIENGQRISMFIGVKSDLFQLGMVLWGLSMEEDEPERQQKPLAWHNAGPDVPDYFRALTASCLNRRPAERKSATEMVKLFPDLHSEGYALNLFPELENPHTNHSSAIVYGSDAHYPRKVSDEDIEDSVAPITKTAGEEIDAFTGEQRATKAALPDSINNETNPTGFERGYHRADVSSIVKPSPDHHENHSHPPTPNPGHDENSPLPYNHESPFNAGFPQPPTHAPRGRQPPTTPPLQSPLSNHSTPPRSPFSEDEPQIVPISPNGGRQWEEITMGGAPYLVPRDILDSYDDDDSDDFDADLPDTKEQAEMVGLRGERAGIAEATSEKEREFEHVDSGLADMELGVGDVGIVVGPASISLGVKHIDPADAIAVTPGEKLAPAGAAPRPEDTLERNAEAIARLVPEPTRAVAAEVEGEVEGEAEVEGEEEVRGNDQNEGNLIDKAGTKGGITAPPIPAPSSRQHEPTTARQDEYATALNAQKSSTED